MKFLWYLLILSIGAAGGWYAQQAYVAPKAPKAVPTREALAQKAAAGNAEAAYQLGEMYLTTQGGAAAPETAAAYFRLAAFKDFMPAQNELARFYEEGLAGVPKNATEGLFWRMLAARGGSAEAQQMVQEAFSQNPAVYAQAFQIFTAYQQARIGSGTGALAFASQLEKGGALNEDEEEAVKWLAVAAERNIPAAQARLGLKYAQGVGVAQDENKAFSLLASAAQAGEPLAQLYWGRRAYTQSAAEGGPDYAEAFKWFMNAADKGNTEAQYLTGVMYMQGQGTEKSVSKALQAFSRAAEGGHASAQYVVGQSYYKGLGIRRNISEARKWLTKAAANGNQAAKDLLEEIK